jgi:hypothetical protein
MKNQKISSHFLEGIKKLKCCQWAEMTVFDLHVLPGQKQDNILVWSKQW